MPVNIHFAAQEQRITISLTEAKIIYHHCDNNLHFCDSITYIDIAHSTTS